MQEYDDEQVTLGEVTYVTGRVKEGEYGWYTLYTRMNVEFLNLLKPA
jgi:hypothetical protein